MHNSQAKGGHILTSGISLTKEGPLKVCDCSGPSAVCFQCSNYVRGECMLADYSTELLLQILLDHGTANDGTNGRCEISHGIGSEYHI